LQYAQEYLDENGIKNVTLQQAKEIRNARRPPQVDLVYSIIVVTTQPTPVIEFILGAWLKALNPGGLAVLSGSDLSFELPLFLRDYMSDQGESLEMEMHVLPQRRLFEIVAQEGCRPLEVIEDNCTGMRSGSCRTPFWCRNCRFFLFV
jgi:hypothetical protein